MSRDNQERLTTIQKSLLFLSLFLFLIAYLIHSIPDQYNEPPVPQVKYYELAYQKCSRDSNWTLHGLWPQTTETKWPEFCNHYKKFNISEIHPNIIRIMLKRWYSCRQKIPIDSLEDHYFIKDNYHFWEHEWEKHGTCSGHNISDYFTITILLDDFMQKHDLFGQYCNSSERCLVPFDLNFTLL